MAKNKDISSVPQENDIEQTEPAAEEQTEPEEAELTSEEIAKLIEVAAAYAAEHEQYMRLAAEYDNFRKRSQKERESVYSDAKAETVAKFLPVYDNLERAIAQPTVDEAYSKGVEMIFGGLVEILEKVGCKPVGAAGEAFDPLYHSAVMHIEDENLGENTIAEVFQKGFSMGDRVIRFAMVKVAN